MSTKRFKDIEEDLKKAAEGYEPPFEESSWTKMEALLDRDKDRRKPLFWLWWLLPLLIGGSVGGYFIFRNEPDKNNSAKDIVVVKNNEPLLPVQKNDNKGIPGYENSPGESGTGVPVKIPGNTPDNSVSHATGSTSGPVNSISKNSQNKSHVEDSKNNTGNKSRVSDETKSNTRVKIESNVATADAEPAPENKNEAIKKIGNERKPLDENPEKHETVTSTGKEDKTIPPGNSPAAKQKQNKSNSSRIYFIATAGIEGSGVKLFSTHKITPRGGLIFGYQLGNRFSVQTGFLAGSKKYVAGPGDYNPKDGTYWSTVDITHVDAECLVYEVPLDVRYDFTPGKSLKIFAASGLSSYIMKTESYDYSYNSYGNPHYGHASYNGNQHLFSVLKLTAGVEKNISKKMAIHAAPAISIPLAGVGEGQVKLYTTEIMIGLRYQPFKKIKNK